MIPVAAARAAGRILLIHILSNVLGPVLVRATPVAVGLACHHVALAA